MTKGERLDPGKYTCRQVTGKEHRHRKVERIGSVGTGGDEGDTELVPGPTGVPG